MKNGLVAIAMAICLFVFFMLLPFAIAQDASKTAMSANYSIFVEENGNAFINLDIYGSGTINLPLPLDVTSPEVERALYIQAPNGVDVFVGTGGSARVTYQSSLLTTKPSDFWEFEMQLPDVSSIRAVLSLPRDVEISKTGPQASIATEGHFMNLYWDIDSPLNETIIVKYRFIKAPPITAAAPPSTRTPAPTGVPVPLKTAEPPSEESAITKIGGLVLIIGVSSLFYYTKMKGRQKIRPSYGSQNVMNTLTENELKIVNILLENGGEIKRNKLERTTDIAKSSLASALYRMEERNILEVDKTGVIHHVRLTEWFRSL